MQLTRAQQLITGAADGLISVADIDGSNSPQLLAGHTSAVYDIGTYAGKGMEMTCNICSSECYGGSLD